MLQNRYSKHIDEILVYCSSIGATAIAGLTSTKHMPPSSFTKSALPRNLAYYAAVLLCGQAGDHCSISTCVQACYNYYTVVLLRYYTARASGQPLLSLGGFTLCFWATKVMTNSPVSVRRVRGPGRARLPPGCRCSSSEPLPLLLPSSAWLSQHFRFGPAS